MGRNEFISISDSKKFTRAERTSREVVLRPARHPDWASCAILGAETKDFEKVYENL